MAASQYVSKTEASKRFLALREQSGNDQCAECHAKDSTWCVLDYGVFICTQCAGTHRGLGTHISKVRSTQHDNFSAAELDWIESQGNAKSASLYEGALPPTMRRPPAKGECPDAVRRMWLRNKYDELRFTAGLDSKGLAPHETLCGWVQMKEPSSIGGFALARWKRRFLTIREGTTLVWYNDEAALSENVRGAVALVEASVSVDPEVDPALLKLRTRPANAKRPSDAPQASGVGGSAFGCGAGGSPFGGGGGGSAFGGGGSSGSAPPAPSLLLRAFSYEEAEMWCWAIYQCAHGASVRTAAKPELASGPLPKRPVRTSLVAQLGSSLLGASVGSSLLGASVASTKHAPNLPNGAMATAPSPSGAVVGAHNGHVTRQSTPGRKESIAYQAAI